MSVFFRLHQDQSVGTKKSGKWYARMVPTSCINTRQLAEIMQRNCTVKKADEAREVGRLRLVQDWHQLEGCPLGEGLHRGRQHHGHAHRVHPRALYGFLWQPREAVPAGCEVRRVA